MAATIPSRAPQRFDISARVEPGRLPAAILAGLVHLGFFAVLVLGVSWQVRHPPQVVAELWEQLPPLKVPEPPPPEPEKVVVKDEPLTVKPDVAAAQKEDIALKARKAKEQREREEKELLEKKKKAEAEKKKREEEAARKAQKAAEDKARAEQAEREAAAQASRNAALNDYASRIRALITSRANIPDTVSGKPAVQVKLRLLVNGAVFDAQVVKPSGNRVYDEAVERAINGIRNWPLPANAELFGGRRELILNIEHER
ncbi:MAG: TonB C-terminal domain-containing protein [Betaproteobacteria bacterium]|nr:TonB C-terminal domain-containing protein [Betaproteobacteria bacterium]